MILERSVAKSMAQEKLWVRDGIKINTTEVRPRETKVMSFNW